MLRASHSIMIERDIEDVYRFVALDFFENYPKWSPEVLELEQLTPGAMRVGVCARQVRFEHGYRYEARFRVASMLPLRELRFTGLSKPEFEACYRFEPEGAFTRLTFEFQLQPTLVMRPFRKRIRAVLEQGCAGVVGNLRAMLEADDDEAVPDAPSDFDSD